MHGDVLITTWRKFYLFKTLLMIKPIYGIFISIYGILIHKIFETFYYTFGRYRLLEKRNILQMWYIYNFDPQ